MDITIRPLTTDKGQACGSLLRQLPEWFGIPEAITTYENDVEHMPVYGAFMQDELCGAIALEPLGATTLEVHLLAVKREWHGHGIGCALIGEAERHAHEDDRHVLLVKTLGPSDPDRNYAATHAFYLAKGFTLLMEIDGLWATDPCGLYLKRLRS